MAVGCPLPSPDELRAWHDHLAKAAQGCVSCFLRKGRTKVVFGKGAIPADVMLVGEGPGSEEDQTGEPFVGPAGELLTKMLAAIQLRRDAVYITNLVRCRPPRNREPLPDEITACTGRWLEAQIELVQPRILVAVGSVASRFFYGAPIKEVRGTWKSWRDIALFSLFHPAHFLWSENEDPEKVRRAKEITWRDLQELRRAIDALPARV